MADVPEGELYARHYVNPGPPTADSERFRRRVAAFFAHRLYRPISEADLLYSLGAEIHFETGTQHLDVPFERWRFDQFFAQERLQDVFAALTITWRHLFRINPRSSRLLQGAARSWLEFVRGALVDENIHYRADDKCGIHPTVDREHERNLASAIAALSEPRFTGALHAANDAFSDLEALPMRGKSAARNIFEAAESMTKTVTVSGASLDKAFVKNTLRPIVDRLFASDKQLLSTANRLLSSFGDWVDAMHPYRHGHERDDPLELPADVTVLAVSQGASFLRWLADIDRRQRDQIV